MYGFSISVIGIFCGGRLGFRVLSHVTQQFGLIFFIHHFVFQINLIDNKVWKAEKENSMIP